CRGQPRLIATQPASISSPRQQRRFGRPFPRPLAEALGRGIAISLLALRQRFCFERRDDVVPGRLHVNVEGPVAEVSKGADLGDWRRDQNERRVGCWHEWAVGTG